MTSTATPQATGPITMLDVRAALGDTDPNATNVNALRARIGRGSNATIQKHLDTLRAERAPVVSSVATGAAPPAPAEAVTAMWAAAWCHAQSLTLGALTTALAQRDAAQERATCVTLERDNFAAELDAELAQHEQAQADALDAQAAAAALRSELALARAEITAVQLAAANAATQAELVAHVKDQVHATEVDRLTTQVGDLKSAMHTTKA